MRGKNTDIGKNSDRVNLGISSKNLLLLIKFY
ncbi:hypothetical protein CPS_3003 [Colwellia psychrerythraea 34H]|uniref:Uncharacterized protein n=1 Tax=Colwellia psychrerythraea (strain 34H / ATCC BAA-681) TaxID=167879 RepID=Q47ZR7_COLP3|nr:hypothetical protein CPS_3003 [Colwellia psychrerythraea 34H]